MKHASVTEILPALGIALFFWTMIDYRLHWVGCIIVIGVIADNIRRDIK